MRQAIAKRRNKRSYSAELVSSNGKKTGATRPRLLACDCKTEKSLKAAKKILPSHQAGAHSGTGTRTKTKKPSGCHVYTGEGHGWRGPQTQADFSGTALDEAMPDAVPGQASAEALNKMFNPLKTTQVKTNGRPPGPGHLRHIVVTPGGRPHWFQPHAQVSCRGS